MENKQTAIDWLFLMINNPNKDQEFAIKLYDKAKEIEKEQIMMAYNDGRVNEGLKQNKNSQQYYEETYGTN